MTLMTLNRAAIIGEARQWIGTPYRHQASLKGVGCDCLGLVRGVWRALIGPEPEAAPRYAPDWAEARGLEQLADVADRHMQAIAIDAARGGDIVLFRWRDGCVAKHAAILSSADTMIHAQDGVAVCEVALSPWWRRRIAYAYRFPGVED